MLQPDGPPEQRRQRIKDLETRKERLEQELSAHSAEFRAQILPVTLDAVQAAMPDDAALIEFAVFRPFNPKIEHNAEAYGPPHYAAYVLRRHEAPVGVDLGLAKPIETAVATFREALRDPRCRDAHGIGRAIGRQVIEPLQAAIGNATRLLVAPDGALNLVPFEAFVGADDHYLIERYAITYLTSGRDLLRLQVPRVSQSRSVIVANPLFGEPARLSTGGDGEARSASGSDGSLYFAPLPSAALEARAIKTLFPDATLVTGKDATEARLEQLNAPTVLHIASHGFFLDKPGFDNPLLRSGLALAGANLTHVHDDDDGILTALEAAGLNLWGTKLVTLSACDTGVGVVRNGEGVYGLRRAFVLAGTETLVMSLWPVSDRITRETMTAYYTGLRSDAGRGDALRQAKLAILAQSAWSHPYYWASFIQSGEWGNLSGKR
jgi:CHAT domain-containing protein